MRNAVFAVAALVSLASCGGGSSGSAAPPPGPGPAAPTNPVITAFSMPSTADAGALLTLSASAAAPGGGAITYQWTQECTGADGAFASPAAATTSWTAPASGGWCVITLRATAGGLFDERGGVVEVIVGPSPANLVGSVQVQFAGAPLCELSRELGTACVASYLAGSTATVTVAYGVGTAQFYTASLLDDCALEPLWDPAASPEQAVFDWTFRGGECRLTARVVTDGFYDEFPFTIANDDFPADDDLAWPHLLGEVAQEITFSSYACDDDHYAFVVPAGFESVRIDVGAGLRVEVYDGTRVPLGSSEDGVVTIPLGGSAPQDLVLRVQQPPGPPPPFVCGPRYDVVITPQLQSP